ncbi:MAG: coniferyl-alcohol dehydrogenase [Chloroflexota bacterium]
MSSLDGKTIIVTGAASGIGAATAALLTERGARVVAFDRSPVMENCVQYIEIDLSSEESIANAAAQFYGTADVLLNISGVPPTVPPLTVLQVNVTGQLLFTDAIVSKIKDGGVIVNAASLAGNNWINTLEASTALLKVKQMADVAAFIEEYGVSEENCYELSKEAIIVWTKQSWNRYQDRGIRMNAVSPSATKTPILQDFIDTVAARLKNKAPGIDGLPGPGTAEDIAGVFAFMCSDDSRWLNGQNLIADGGLHAARSCQALGI